MFNRDYFFNHLRYVLLYDETLSNANLCFDSSSQIHKSCIFNFLCQYILEGSPEYLYYSSYIEYL